MKKSQKMLQDFAKRMCQVVIEQSTGASDFARKTGISYSQINGFFRNAKENAEIPKKFVSLELLVAIFERGYSVDWVLFGQGSPKMVEVENLNLQDWHPSNNLKDWIMSLQKDKERLQEIINDLRADKDFLKKIAKFE